MKSDFLVIPAIDIYENQVVRLYEGKYEQIKVYSSDPLEWLDYFKKGGIQRIHVVDLNAAKDGNTKINQRTIHQILNHKDNVKIEIGGGIRSEEIIKYYFDMGVDYLILGTIAVKSPKFVESIITKYPKERLIVGVDVRNENVYVSGWQENSSINLFSFLKQIETWEIPQIILTDISKDGTLRGPNIELIKSILPKTKLKVISSGGIRDVQDVIRLKNISFNNLVGTIIGKALYEKTITLEELKKLNDL
ncbi:MAG: 1-(5-phosphoribosyl)-5-[(5-phosphoribosylamino)methylideneamino]imidazole-4-carboxamide isomerase [Leptospiraceae bacterium]|nr:1-(5-phosphoribosyl)-5-[(5-phosphoribosylamino)methylideneamino]imidazole-4-carboxamide isomerase [Leptospiraceae bacterium]MDW7976420.1 1-(5-phosphoribosyl)-5-[(5-phosphoribosylamino)methylideneamino]imidazole-4-carboxamide isomerase [Leptospiraceae bacterium]